MAELGQGLGQGLGQPSKGMFNRHLPGCAPSRSTWQPRQRWWLRAQCKLLSCNAQKKYTVHLHAGSQMFCASNFVTLNRYILADLLKVVVSTTACAMPVL